MHPKYKLEKLFVEITRRCNKECLHCMHGTAQNANTTEEIIDKIFDDIEDVMYIVLGSGEVLLEIPKVAYFIQKLLDSSWSTSTIEITTNGTICDKSIIDILELFCQFQNGNYALLRISNDQFHDVRQYRRAYEFYRPLVDAVNAKIQKENRTGGILLTYTQTKSADLKSLLYTGNAVELIDSGQGKYQHGKNVRYPFTSKHRVKILENTIPCMLHISFNGNIGFHEEASYDGLDSLSFGNIMSHTVSELIEKHNDSCLLLCSEADCQYFSKYSKYYGNTGDSSHYILQYQDAIHEKILELRHKVKELFPHVPTRYIIDRLPFPNNSEELELVLGMYQNCPDFNESILDNLKDKTAFQTMCQAVLAYINNKAIPRKYPYELFGTEDDITQSLKLKFATLDRFYIGKPGVESNSKAYLCDITPNGISYDVDTERIDWGRYMEELERMASEEMQEQYSDNSQRKEML